MVSLTPFRFSWTQDRGNGKNPVPVLTLPATTEHSSGRG